MSQSSAPRQSDFSGKIQWDKGSRGVLELEAGNKAISPSPTGDDTVNIQTAIDTISEAGGGFLLLQSGTYTVSSNITLRSAVGLRGAKESTTILNFNSNSASLSFADSGVYNTGTITSINGGVSVTGSGTSWLANVTAGQYLFIANRHYPIAAVTSNTTLILAEGYIGNATLPGAAYRISSILTDVDFAELTIKSSADDGLKINGCKNITMTNMTFLQNNVGFDWDFVTECKIDNVVSVSNTSDGVQMTSCGFGDIEGLASVSNGGNGFTLNTLETMPFHFSAASSNTGDGVNATSVIKSYFSIEARANGGQGMELVSGCDNNFITICIVANNTSDGIKLTATCDRNIVTGNIINSNGGWGINIAASTCDKNLIHGNQYSLNTSGTLTDSGTSTTSADNVT